MFKNAKKELTINTTLIDNNGQRHPNINYPISHFEHKDDKDNNFMIVIYDVLLGSLYSIFKKINKQLKIDTIYKIIPQLMNGMNFIHSCGYIHTDIKTDNILMVGNNNLQKNILQYSNKYNIHQKFPKSFNIKNYDNINNHKIIKNIVNTFIVSITSSLNLSKYEISLKSTSEYNSSDSNSSEQLDSNYSDETLSCKTLSFDDDDSIESVFTYDSTMGRYFENYDIFHTKYIISSNDENNTNENNSNENNENDSNENNEISKSELITLQTLLELPIIKITDFDLIKKHDSKKYTRLIRQFRTPEIILGLDFDLSVDLWSIRHMIYELITDDVILNPRLDDMANNYDLDLITIKLFFEKICYDKILTKDLLELINMSKRKDYILNIDSSLKFVKKLNIQYWTTHINDEKINIFIKNLLQIDPNKRKFIW